MSETEFMEAFQEPAEGGLHVEETEGGFGIIEFIQLPLSPPIWAAAAASDVRIVVIPDVLG